ncbi:MAG: glucose-1-phosphate adenylyltransferase subunit GlgD [Clostridia bacterium]|jgi:glucose-1-phosphate adenylyltransferase|nr:glucose-1-phosphate adenylyltransferase subunit GlgD [Clostridia bacterium]
MSSAAGFIFSNIHDGNIAELTKLRTIASVPFGCRYRFIDFALSNMVNSDIYNVNVITQHNYHSLMDHIGSGKDWDLARRSGGVKILPPNITAYAGSSGHMGYASRLEALKSTYYSLSRVSEDYIILSDCDVICNIDLNDILKYHISKDADMTFAVKKMEMTRETARNNTIYYSDADGRITDVLAYPQNFEGEADICLNIIVAKTGYLQQAVLDAIAHNYTSLNRDIIAKNFSHDNFRVYRYDGIFGVISSLADYFEMSMKLISSPEVRDQLFNVRNRPVYTKVRNSVPTYYAANSKVNDSLIADGCDIHGTVENSILFRGVKVGKGAVVKNSILMQDTIVGSNASLNCVISDKNTVIRDGRVLSGAEEAPYYIVKGKMI